MGKWQVSGLGGLKELRERGVISITQLIVLKITECQRGPEGLAREVGISPSLLVQLLNYSEQ